MHAPNGLPGPAGNSLPAFQPPEREITIGSLWGVARRNRLSIFAAFIIVPILSGIISGLVTPVYQSELSMRIDEKKSGLPVLEALSKLTDQAGELNTEMQMLRSRLLAEQTVDSLSLQVSARAPVQIGLWTFLGRSRKQPSRSDLLTFVRARRDAKPNNYRLTRQTKFRFAMSDSAGEVIRLVEPGQLVDIGNTKFVLSPQALDYSTLILTVARFDNSVTNLRKQVTVSRPEREATFVTVRYDGTDPDLASEVPNVLADRFLNIRNQILKTEARSTAAFLRERIDTLATQVSSTEQALRSFREGNQVVNLAAEATVRVTELTRMQAERDAKVAERDALQQALTQAQATSNRNGTDSASAYRSLVAFPTLIGTNAAEFLQALNDAENQRALLLQRRTRQDRDVQVLTARIRELERQLTENVHTYLSGLSSQIASLSAALARFGTQMEKIPSKEMQFVRLERQNKVLADIYMLLQTRLQEAQIAQATEDSRARVIDPAARPLGPVKPNRKQYVMLGALFGLAIGLGISLVREMMDRTIHTREDMAEMTGAPSLGLIPHIDPKALERGQELLTAGGRNAKLAQPVATLSASGNPITEAYRALRTNITFSRPDERLRSLVFTSPTPGDGKSTTAANLALTLAHLGGRALLIDADLRRGSLNKLFSIDREPGLSNILIGASTVEECVQRIEIEDFGSLDVIPSGPFPPNPSELFSGKRMADFVRAMEDRYDVLIFDSPPVTLVTDAAIIGTMTSGVIMIGRAGHTDKGALAYATEQLTNVRATIIGTVLNDFDFQRDVRYAGYGSPGYYNSTYGYAYSTQSYGPRETEEDDRGTGLLGSLRRRLTNPTGSRRNDR